MNNRKNFYLEYFIDALAINDSHLEYSKEKAFRDVGLAYARKYATTEEKFMYHDITSGAEFDLDIRIPETHTVKFVGVRYLVTL